jgi:hypothetical protein
LFTLLLGTVRGVFQSFERDVMADFQVQEIEEFFPGSESR